MAYKYEKEVYSIGYLEGELATNQVNSDLPFHKSLRN